MIVAFVGIFPLTSAFAGLVKIIVHPKNPIKEVTRKFLSDAFYKKIVFWENGESIIPVDRESAAESRKEFSDKVMNKSVTAVRSYWQQMIFSGQAIPPVEFDTEEKVIQFVATHPNAVAYVSETAVLTSKVKVVTLK